MQNFFANNPEEFLIENQHCQPIKSYILWKLITPTITWPTDKVDKVDKDKDKVDKMYKDKGMRWMNGEVAQGGRGRRDGQGGQG